MWIKKIKLERNLETSRRLTSEDRRINQAVTKRSGRRARWRLRGQARLASVLGGGGGVLYLSSWPLLPFLFLFFKFIFFKIATLKLDGTQLVGSWIHPMSPSYT